MRVPTIRSVLLVFFFAPILGGCSAYYWPEGGTTNTVVGGVAGGGIGAGIGAAAGGATGAAIGGGIGIPVGAAAGLGATYARDHRTVEDNSTLIIQNQRDIAERDRELDKLRQEGYVDSREIEPDHDRGRHIYQGPTLGPVYR